jgi:uncharacterized protein (DUF4415 family)
MGKIVSYPYELGKLPPRTEKQKAGLKESAKRPIDYSDIPPAGDEDWTGAIRGKYYRVLKESTTLRIDADVLEWLKSSGKGYQTRINAILRREMLQSMSK